jgi:hypothetical protein
VNTKSNAELTLDLIMILQVSNSLFGKMSQEFIINQLRRRFLNRHLLIDSIAGKALLSKTPTKEGGLDFLCYLSLVGWNAFHHLLG